MSFHRGVPLIATPKNVLLIRLDKIGDLISTLCVDQAPLESGNESRWVIAKGMGFVPDHAVPPRNYTELKKDSWRESLPKLRLFIREFKPDVAVSFQAPWWVNFALWIERVPVRAGVLSQWHSFLFLSRGLRQKRNRSTQHEADYNLELLAYALDYQGAKVETPILKLKAPENEGLLDKYHLNPKDYVVVHPGMAGSALNWPVENYISLIEKISRNVQIVLTGTPADEEWLSEIKQRFQGASRVVCLQSLLSASELLTILENAKAVVAPSTGVSHLAASLGTLTIGLYSPLRVQHPKRWAARGPRVQVLMGSPDVTPETCMKTILVDEVIEKLAGI